MIRKAKGGRSNSHFPIARRKESHDILRRDLRLQHVRWREHKAAVQCVQALGERVHHPPHLRGRAEGERRLGAHTAVKRQAWAEAIADGEWVHALRLHGVQDGDADLNQVVEDS